MARASPIDSKSGIRESIADLGPYQRETQAEMHIRSVEWREAGPESGRYQSIARVPSGVRVERVRPGFPRAIVLAAALAQAAACAHMAAGEATDLVVLGQAKTLSAETLDEWGLNALFTARLKVIRAVRGKPPSSRLTIRYVAHDSFVMNHKREFHLRRSKDGVWLVCAEGGAIGYVCP